MCRALKLNNPIVTKRAGCLFVAGDKIWDSFQSVKN